VSAPAPGCAWRRASLPAGATLLSLVSLVACREPSGPVTRLRTLWYQEQGGLSRARPAVLGDLVYFGTGNSARVVARDRLTGVERWSTPLSASPIAEVEGANIVARSGIVVAHTAQWVFGLDAVTGRERWRYASPPDVPAWRPNPPRPGQVVASRFDADDEAVYVGAWGASVSAVELRTAAPVVWQHLVIVATSGGDLWGIDSRSQRLAWQVRAQMIQAAYTGPELYDGVVYYDGGDGRVHGRRAADGTLVWATPYQGQIGNDLLVTERRVYATSFPLLTIFDRHTGAVVAMTEPPRGTLAAFGSPLAFFDGRIFATVSDGAWSFDEP
jgi:outer membrane protein assembly factor BamB